MRCDCGLVILSPRPIVEELAFYYPESDYYSYSSGVSVQAIRSGGVLHRIRDGLRRAVLSDWGYPMPDLRPWERMVRPIASRLVANSALYGMADKFPHYRPGGRALDIGCGNGSFLTYLKHHGWEVAGVELSAAAARAAKEQFGIDVFVGDLADAPFAPASFDFIHLSHVIEHVPDPTAVLRSAASLLRPGGTVYIETPNEASFGAHVCGEYWFPWESPRHLYVFSPATLRGCIEAAGLRVTRMWTGKFHNLFAWEDTYRQEECGATVPVRPSLRTYRRPRAVVLDAARRVTVILRPLSGDILFCLAEIAR